MFWLYSILYDGWKIILELLGGSGVIFEKYFKKNFGNRPHSPGIGNEILEHWFIINKKF